MLTGYKRKTSNEKVIYKVYEGNEVVYTYNESKYRQYTEYVAKRSFKLNKRINSIVLKKSDQSGKYAELVIFKDDVEYRVKIDRDIVDIVEDYSWSIKINNGKVTRVVTPRGITLSRLILELDKGDNYKDYIVDLKNNNRLDYRSDNLIYTHKNDSITKRCLSINNKVGISGIAKCENYFYVTIKGKGKTYRKMISFNTKRKKRTEEQALKEAIKYRNEVIKEIACKNNNNNNNNK